MARENVKLQQYYENFKMKTQRGMQNITSQLLYLTQAVARMEKKLGQLPTRVQLNTKAQVNAIALKSGKMLPEDERWVALEKV